MSAIVVLGAGFGLGLWLLFIWLNPAPPELSEVLAAMAHEPMPALPAPTSLDDRIGRVLMRNNVGTSALRHNARRDLILAEVTMSSFLGAKAICALVGLVIGPALSATLTILGHSTGIALPAVSSLALSALGFFLPDLDLGNKADKRRKSFRKGLSSFLDVTTLALAGGELISGALHLAANAGHGWVFGLLRSTLDDAEQRNMTPWDALAVAGEDRGLSELVEVAASVRLAGTDGARVRQTLAVKGSSLRARTMADTEAEAGEATTRMVLPLVGIAFGFLILVGYPAISRIIGGS